MDNNRQIDVGGLLGSIASMLAQDQGQLNQIDAYEGKGNHGTRVAQAFEAAAQGAQRADTQDAGAQFAAAAQAMREQGRGKAIGFYASGLDQAAAQFQGKSGISVNDLGPLLEALAGGVQQGNPARPGQGTMLDALLPAAEAFMNAKQGGVDNAQAAIQALTQAAGGAYGTMQADGGRVYGAGQGRVDPGAASATSVLGGIFQALLPTVAGMAMQQFDGSSRATQRQSDYGQAQGDPLGGLLGGLLGGMGEPQTRADQMPPPQQPGDTVA